MMRQKLMQNVIKDLMKVPMKPKGPGAMPVNHPKSTTIAITEHGHTNPARADGIEGVEDPEHEAMMEISPHGDTTSGHPEYEDEEIDLSPDESAHKPMSAMSNKKLHAMRGK